MIKNVTASDFRALAGLAKRAILQSVEARPAVKEQIIADTKAHIAQGMSGAEHVFLKQVDGDGGILGFILVKNSWNLSDLFVEPGAHHRGVGRRLFQEALSVIVTRENRGYIRVNSSLNAEGFYRRLGFESFKPEKPCPDFVVPLIFRFAPEPPKL